MRDRLDGLWCDEEFADWYPRDGRPGLSPAQPATVCVLQFLLNPSDRKAAEAVLCRRDFTYALAKRCLLPAEHLLDGGYLSVALLDQAGRTHGVTLI
ncbi:hypothetical protein [Streptomyces sp. NPDC127119]|uniref:hypothetical protein n=1 Tax=Streptomyces sp. NPDC127119 TaxID=3345370 RepID=UPI00363C3C8E